MKKFLILLMLCVAGVLSFGPVPTLAQTSFDETIASTPQDEYFVGKVIRIVSEETTELFDGTEVPKQVLQIEGTSKGWEGEKVVTEEITFDVLASRKYSVGDRVVVSQTVNIIDDTVSYFVIDHYRVPMMLVVAIIFVFTVLWIMRWQGARALLGLVISLLLIVFVLLPLLLNGYNPLNVALVVGAIILLVNFYVIHGWSMLSHLAAASTIINMIITLGVILMASRLTQLSGFAHEEIIILSSNNQLGGTAVSLLLATIVIGVIGVLDDVIVSQVSVVEELKRANQNYTQRDLYRAGMKVGVDHSSSVVNTLFLTYTGTALPLFLLHAMQSETARIPLAILFNTEIIATEIVRMLAGSLAILLAVPLATALSAFVYARIETLPPHKHGHSHVHTH